MNVSPSAHAALKGHGAHASGGKGGDPLADFMALLGQLGITTDADGTLTTAGPTLPADTQEVAAKMLAKLGKKATDEKKPASDGPVEAVIDDQADDSNDSKKSDDDPLAKLTALLANVDQGVSPDKLDPASLLSAVRAIATGSASQPAKADASTADALLSPATAAPAAKPAVNIAALLARANPDKTAEQPTPGQVQSAFAHVEKLAAAATEEGKAATKPDDQTVESDLPKAADGTPEPGKAATKLTELLARLTASVKPGAAQQQLPLQAATPTQPQPDPQFAALTQALEVKDDRKADRPSPQPTTDPSAAVARLAAISSPAPIANVAPPAPAIAQQSAAAEVAPHHLDLVKDSEWLDSLAKDITRAAQSDTHLRFQLNPEHLGSLKVEVLNGANGTSVKLTADTEAARAILVDAQPRLVAEARAQGLRISEAQVNLNSQSGQGGQRHPGEAPLVVRTSAAAAIAEVEQDAPGGSGERYA
jgi:flagellar hook-length control protein FliK